jgi:branched-chain amino acid transport system permease protein
MWGILFVIAAWLFKASSLGLKLRASRDSQYAAISLGISIVRARWVAYVLSAFACGFGGALWAHFITSFSPTAFYLTQTFVILTMLIVGGTQTVSGAVVGTVLVTAFHEGLRQVENSWNLKGTLPFQAVGVTEVALAVILILVVALRPGGIIQERELTLWRRRRQDRAPAVLDTSRIDGALADTD